MISTTTLSSIKFLLIFLSQENVSSQLHCSLIFKFCNKLYKKWLLNMDFLDLNFLVRLSYSFYTNLCHFLNLGQFYHWGIILELRTFEIWFEWSLKHIPVFSQEGFENRENVLHSILNCTWHSIFPPFSLLKWIPLS